MATLQSGQKVAIKAKMGLLLQLAGAFVLFVAGFELWRLLVGCVFTLIMKAGLLANISVDPHTKVSVTAAAVKISFWTQLWKFLRAPTREKLVVLELPSVHLLVVKNDARVTTRSSRQKAAVRPSFWHTLDTTISLQDIRHPLWRSVRVWIPRLLFLCRCVHIFELGVGSISVDVVKKDKDGATPVLNIQHGSVFVSAMFHTKTRELSCTVTLSRRQPMKLTVQGFETTAVLGNTEVSVRVPISHGAEVFRAPIPSAYSVVIDLIQVNLNFEHLVRAALRPTQPGEAQPPSNTSMGDFDTMESALELTKQQMLTVLRLAELSPRNLRCVIHKLEVNIVGRLLPRSSESVCALGLSSFSVVLSGDPHQEVGAVKRISADCPVVIREADVAFGPLVIHLSDADARSDIDSVSPPILKLDGLKINAEGTLSGDVTACGSSDEVNEDDVERHSLSCRSTVSGESRGLDVTFSKTVKPWMASCCLLVDQEAVKVHDLPSPYLCEDADQVEQWSALDYCEIDLDAHFKMVRTEVTVISLDRTCDVLPKGVPSTTLSLSEINVYGHPFVGVDHLGVRAKADIQCSRLKVSYFTSNDLVKYPFLSLDFARVFISPVATMMQRDVPAEVEMEAEWVEVKWAPEVLHAIGEVLELGIFTAAPFLHESRQIRPEKKCEKSSDGCGWAASSRLKVPPMRQMEDVTQDNVSPGEVLAFRCIAKRICVIFPHVYDGQRQVDCVSVDTFTVSTEETSGRLRISILEARAFPSRRQTGEMPAFSTKPDQTQAQHRRKSFTTRASRRRTIRSKDTSTVELQHMSDNGAAFFVADCFSLEENQVVGSSKTVVDLFVNGAKMEWDISTQLRIMELIRRITFSSWEMIYRARSAYAVHCTAVDSIYNRPHGLNPPLDDVDECLRYEEMFADLISASGDKLHRLHATNISVNAKLCDEVDVQLAVGVFAGDDLPEVWLFEDISLKVNNLDMAAVGAIRVRHTIDNQVDYVFGEFEEMLRKRLSACKRATEALDQNLMDGVLVGINKLRLRTSRDFPLQRFAVAVRNSFDPYTEKVVMAASAYWRPQQELFYQFFLRTPMASHQKGLWLRLEEVGFECLGCPLESWLERMYPVWIEELAEQELRTHMLDDHVATLKLTNADLLSDDSYQEMKTLLTEKNARMYIQRVKKLSTLESERDDGPLINVGIGTVNVDVAFEEDIVASWSSIKDLDEATELVEKMFRTVRRDFTQFTPSCRLFLGVQLNVGVSDLTVRMRRFSTPLMVCDRLSVGGQVFLTAFNSGSSAFDLMAAVRCFMDLSVEITSPVLYFNPSYLYAMDELAGLALELLPLVVFDIDRHHQTSVVDIARRLLHGKVTVSVKDAAVRLLCAETSFESTDFLEISVHRVRVAYASGSIDVDVTRVTAKIEPGSLSHIAELSHLKLQVWLKWGCLGHPALHYIYPVVFIGDKNTNVEGERFTLSFPDPVDAANNNLLQAFHATKLSVFVSGRICPADPENGDPNSNDGWSKRDMAARTAIVLYSKNLEWLIGFGRLYQKVPLYPLPRRRNGTANSLYLPSTDVLGILEGVTVEEFDLIGLDLALYANEKHPVGVRAFIDDKISCSGTLLKSSHEIFDSKGTTASNSSEPATSVRRLSFTMEDATWVVHDVNVDARDIQVRVCTPESGSRGESLVCIKHVSLIVGGGAERAPTHDNGLLKLHSPPPMRCAINDKPFAFSQKSDAKERPKQSILEYFEIPHENPFSYRESDSDAEGEIGMFEAQVDDEVGEVQNEVLDEFRRLGFLLGLLSKEVRVTVTMAALGSLVDIADTWIEVVVASLPEIFSDAAEAAALLENKEEESVDSELIVEESDPSPKKFTSLAQDPKFSGISLQGGAETPVNPDDSQRFEPTPYSNADTVRPVRRHSSKVTSLLEPLRSKEETEPSRAASSKLVQAFIMVKFEDIQISVQDQLHKGSVLVALNAGMLQDAVSADTGHERISLNVDGLQVFTAPLDVDVKSHAIWLKALADGSYCPSSYGLLRQVIAPIPAQVTVWIDREKALVKNKVKLEIPSIEVQVNMVSKEILEKLATTASELINTKLAEKKKPDHSHLLHGYLRDHQHQERSLHQLVALKRQLKWKISALQWRQLCGWDYRMNERAMTAVSAAESARSLPFEVETSPLFRRRKMSSASVSSASTSISMVNSTATNRYEDDQFADELQRMTQQYESLCELTRFMANEIQKQLKPNPLPNVDMEFALDRASLMLSGENVDIVRAQVGPLCFKMQLFEDHSGNFALTLQDLSVNNLSPGTPYPDLLLPVYSRSWEGDDMFLRVDAEVAKPVGGITVVQHFEVNVHPIQVCITQEVVMQLVTFFSPSDSANTTKEEQRDEVRSQFLQARTVSSSGSDGRVGSAIIKAVKVAGKAAAHPLSLGRTHRGDSDEELLSSGRKPRGGALHHIPEDPSHWFAKLVNLSESNELPLFGASDETEQLREMSEMKDRAKNSILFKRIRLGAVEVVLTYKNKRSSLGSGNAPHLHLPHTAQPQALEDMRGFEVKTHALVYCDKTCSPMDLVLRVRRDILLDVLSQVGRNFTNIGNFLRDQFDPSRLAAFDALAPLKSLSTTVSSLTAHTGAVTPLAQPGADSIATEGTIKEQTSTPTSMRPTELLHEWETRGVSDLTDNYDADTSTPSTPTSNAPHPKQMKAKRSLTNLFSRKKSSSPRPMQ